jgi:hypothetical protein
LVGVFALACSSMNAATPSQNAPGVVIPTHLGEGHGDGAPAELPSASAEAVPAASAPALPRPFTNDPPDPPPLRQAEQYEYTFEYANGAVQLLGVRAMRYPKPIVTARRIGRFAVELWIGHELVDRVRFDFPLLGGDEMKTGPRPIGEAPSMQGGSFTITVVVPAARRARSARLVDRASRTESELAWPPAPAGIGPAGPMPVATVGAGLAEPDSAASGAAAAPAAPSSAVPAASGSAPGAAPPKSPPAAGSSAVTPPSSAAPAAAPPARAHPR